MILVPGLNTKVLLSQQVGILDLLGLIALVAGDFVGTLTDGAYTTVVACVVGILSPVGPQLLAYGTV